MPDGPVVISSYDPGYHGANLEETISRLDKEATWKDLSCIAITPTGRSVPTKCCFSWLNMIKPPNNRFTHIGAIGVEVGEAYSRTIEGILNHPELSKWKYILTIEHDNCIPPDGLMKLLRDAEEFKEFAAFGGLYFTKGFGGVAQIWGDPHEHPINFRPQKPDPNGGFKECNGLGMGFTLFRLDMFKDERLRRPWFKTIASREEGVGTQDLYFFSDVRKYDYRCVVDCSVKVGHYDIENDVMW